MGSHPGKILSLGSGGRPSTPDSSPPSQYAAPIRYLPPAGSMPHKGSSTAGIVVKVLVGISLFEV